MVVERHPKCKNCDSLNTGTNEVIGGRQRYKCYDCGVFFFNDSGDDASVPYWNYDHHHQPFNLKHQTPPKEKVITTEDIALPTNTPKKLYKCKKCDFHTPDRYELNRHYSSKHSYHYVSRNCILCGASFTTSSSVASAKWMKLCPTCVTKVNFPPKPIWINHNRYSIYDQCPICGKFLIFHVMNNAFCKVTPEPKQYVNKHYGLIGRPKHPTQYCKECGKEINPRPYRVKQGGGNYCKECFNKLHKPPVPIYKDGERMTDNLPNKPPQSTEELAMKALTDNVNKKLSTFMDRIKDDGSKEYNAEDWYNDSYVDIIDARAMHDFLLVLMGDVHKLGDNERVRGMIYTISVLANFYKTIDDANPETKQPMVNKIEIKEETKMPEGAIEQLTAKVEALTKQVADYQAFIQQSIINGKDVITYIKERMQNLDLTMSDNGVSLEIVDNKIEEITNGWVSPNADFNQGLKMGLLLGKVIANSAVRIL